MTTPERSLFEILRSYPRPVYVIFLGTFINRFGTFVVPFLALHLTRLGYSTREAGLGVGAYGAGHFLASAVGGHLADTLGRRNTIVISMFSAALAMMFLSQAQQLSTILALAFFAGLTAEFYKPASSALLADLVPASERVTAFAAYRFAINAGWAFGPATAGLLAGHGYFWLFVVDAATSVLFGIVAFIGLPVLNPGRRGDWRRVLRAFSSLKEAAVMALADRRFVQLLLAAFAVALVFMQIFSTFGLETQRNGLGEPQYGLLLALNGVLIVLFEIPLTTLTRRLEARVTMAIGYAAIGLSFVILAWARTFGDYVVVLSVFTFGEMISMPVALAYVSHLAPESMRGRYLGVFGLTWAAALTLGPGVGMSLFAVSPFGLWILCSLAAGVGALIILLPVEQAATAPSLICAAGDKN